MEEVLQNYWDKIAKAHEDLAKGLADLQENPFTLPLTSIQIGVLQEFVNIVFPIRDIRIDQTIKTENTYLSVSAPPSLKVNVDWWEKMFSYFFIKPVKLSGPLEGYYTSAIRRVHFFSLSADL